MVDFETFLLPENERVLKIFVLEYVGTGKTSVVRKFVSGEFSELYRATIGVDFGNKNLDWNSNLKVSLQL
jgi:GTPase SAR1 family protein